MRRLNSSINVDFISEKGADNADRTYFAYVPLENMVCYAVAESYDGDNDINSAKLAVESVLTAFERNPSFRNVKRYIQYAHDEIVANSVKNRLEAAITVVISDYTRIQYASCGNIKFFLLSDNTFYTKSETQTYYQFSADEYGQDKAPLSENRNLLQFLGKSNRPKPYVSKKRDLPEGSTMVFVTSSIWERVDDVEILDAYEDAAEQSSFLNNIQELYLLTQLKHSAISSYTIASLYVEKTFKEDNAKKKKRRRIIIIAAAVLILVLLILAVIISINRAADRHAMAEIKRLDSEGMRYSAYGNYTMSYDQYDKASGLTENLKNNLHYKKEKKELSETIAERWHFFNSIIKGDTDFETSDFYNARTSYQNAQNVYADIYTAEDSNSGLLIAKILVDKIETVEKYIEMDELIKIAEMYEAIGMYQEALAKYREAEEIAKAIGDLELRKEIITHIFEASEKMNGLIELKPVLQLRVLMERAESDLDFEMALEYCNMIATIYSDLGIADNQTPEDIIRIKRKVELNTEAENYIEKAKEAEAESRYDDAVRNYGMALKIYENMEIGKSNKLYGYIEDEIFRIEDIKTAKENNGKEAEEEILRLNVLMHRAENDMDFESALLYRETIANMYLDFEIADNQTQDDLIRIERKIELCLDAEGYIEMAKEAESILRYDDAVRNYVMALKLYDELGIGAGHKQYRHIEDEIFRLEGVIAEEERKKLEAEEAAKRETEEEAQESEEDENQEESLEEPQEESQDILDAVG